MAQECCQPNLSAERNIGNRTLRAFGGSSGLLCRRCIGAIFYVIEKLTDHSQRSTAHLVEPLTFFSLVSGEKADNQI